ncbi:hypothetical protein ABPG74_012640 [Tetrahymena malaccensis]
MGCNQSRKEYSFNEQEVKKLKEFFQKTANSYSETKDKNELNVQAFKDLFPENLMLGERLHEFMLKNSSSGKVDVEIFIEVLELIIRKSSNKSLSDTYLKHDVVGLLSAILFPHMRKSMQKKEYINIVINYSEALDLILTILHMLNANPDQKMNDALSRQIVDRIFPNNDTKVEFWTFGMLVKDQINLIASLIHVYFKSKFLDGTVPFLLPQMPENSKQQLVKQEQLIHLYLNNQYLLNSNQLKLLYQADVKNYNFDQFSSQLTSFQGQTFILLQFVDAKGEKYTVGGFSSQKWGQTDSLSMENYIFQLSPKYRHYYPVIETNQYSQYTKPLPTSYLFTQESYGREPGLVFGLSKDDCRIWIDGKDLSKSFVKTTEKHFKKGYLIPQAAENPQCVLIEVYGVQSDQSRRMFTYSTINNLQLNQILAGSRDLRNSLTMNLDASRTSFQKTSAYQSNTYNTPATLYRTEDETVKRSAPKISESIYTPQSGTTTTTYQTYTVPQTTTVNPSYTVNLTTGAPQNYTTANTTTTTYTTTSGKLPEYKSYYPGEANYSNTTYTPVEGQRYSSLVPGQTSQSYSYQVTGQRNTTVN